MRVLRRGEAYVVGALQTMYKNMINKNNRFFCRSIIFLPAGPSVKPLKKWLELAICSPEMPRLEEVRDSQLGYISPRKITRLDQNNKLKY